MSEMVDRVFDDNASASDKYLAQLNGKKAEIVDVTVPSGFVFRFEKPAKFRMLFEYRQLPSAATSGAVQKWVDDGVIAPGEIDEDTAKQIEEGIKLTDRVLALSQYPTKLVVVDNPGEGEIDARLLADDDAEYLFAWVQSGGNVSLMLGNFPGGPTKNVVSQPDSGEIRATAKRASRHK